MGKKEHRSSYIKIFKSSSMEGKSKDIFRDV